MAKGWVTASPQEVAEGLLVRSGVSSAALVDAIHLVNPSGLKLGESARAKRYALRLLRARLEKAHQQLPRTPDHPVLLVAGAEIEVGAHPQKALERCPSANELGDHREHLMAIALRDLERYDLALSHLERISDGSRCDTEGWREWIAALQGRAPPKSLGARLVAAVRTAGRLRDEGRVDEALQVLDTAVVWGALDLDVAGLCAELAMSVTPTARLLRRRLVARFLDLVKRSRWGLTRGYRWPQSILKPLDLERLLRRAREWLDEGIPGE
jgi:hypothetical protein